MNGNDRADKLAKFICRYIEADVKIYNVIRTCFDELDGTLRGGGFLRPNGRVRWFNRADLANPNLRQFILKEFPFVSPAARSLLKEREPNGILPEKDRLVCDHVVPCGVLEDLLRHQHQRETLTPASVLAFRKQLYRRCIVTQDEDGQLSRRSMPTDWAPGDPVFARYHQAGFKWAEKWS